MTDRPLVGFPLERARLLGSFEFSSLNRRGLKEGQWNQMFTDAEI
jgi:hypothetical protein